MKRDEVKAIFGDSITDEQLKALMDINGNDVNAAKGELEAANAKNAELAKKVAELESKQQKNASGEKTLKMQIAELQAKQAAAQAGYNRMSAKSELSKLNLSDEDMGNLLDMVVCDDLEKTNSMASAMAAIIKSQREESAAEAVKNAQSNVGMPKGGSGEGGATTKEQFDKLSYSEMVSFKAENPELFKQFTQQD